VLEGLAERLLAEESLDEAALTEFFAQAALRGAGEQVREDEGRS
jgi:hypothetical protein